MPLTCHLQALVPKDILVRHVSRLTTPLILLSFQVSRCHNRLSDVEVWDLYLLIWSVLVDVIIDGDRIFNRHFNGSLWWRTPTVFGCSWGLIPFSFFITDPVVDFWLSQFGWSLVASGYSLLLL